jgi:hypothetical protein
MERAMSSPSSFTIKAIRAAKELKGTVTEFQFDLRKCEACERALHKCPLTKMNCPGFEPIYGLSTINTGFQYARYTALTKKGK